VVSIAMHVVWDFWDLENLVDDGEAMRSRRLTRRTHRSRLGPRDITNARTRERWLSRAHSHRLFISTRNQYPRRIPGSRRRSALDQRLQLRSHSRYLGCAPSQLSLAKRNRRGFATYPNPLVMTAPFSCKHSLWAYVALMLRSCPVTTAGPHSDVTIDPWSRISRPGARRPLRIRIFSRRSCGRDCAPAGSSPMCVLRCRRMGHVPQWPVHRTRHQAAGRVWGRSGFG
jgi:hypothetical protein